MKAKSLAVGIIVIINASIGVGLFLFSAAILLFGAGQVVHANYASGSAGEKSYIIFYIGSLSIFIISLIIQPMIFFLFLVSKNIAYKFFLICLTIGTLALSAHILPSLLVILKAFFSSSHFQIDGITRNYLGLILYQVVVIYFYR